MPRKLFCEISPWTYKISVLKERMIRNIQWMRKSAQYTNAYSEQLLPILICSHNSLMRRKLGDIDALLQENKVHNLNLALPKINHILIEPGKTFSFWKLVGPCSKQKGYKEGLIIKKGIVGSEIGGGMCQFTNLIHWMILHSSLDILEHHHHNQMDLFPDHERLIPFGTGTSILYNYLDYTVKNNTPHTYQIVIYTTDTHLCGELRCTSPETYNYKISEVEAYFTQESEGFFRNNTVIRETVHNQTGKKMAEDVLVVNHDKVCYDSQYINPAHIRK